MAYIPNPETVRDAICRILHKSAEPLRLREICESLPRVSSDSAGAALGHLRRRNAVEYSREGWKLSADTRQEYDADQPTKGPVEIVGAKYIKPFTPMKASPTAIHADKIREMSFMNGGVFYQSGELASVGSYAQRKVNRVSEVA